MEDPKFIRKSLLMKIKKKLEADLLLANNVNLSNVVQGIKNRNPTLFPTPAESFIDQLKVAVQNMFWGNTMNNF